VQIGGQVRVFLKFEKICCDKRTRIDQGGIILKW
jgi:hypothetical protein